MAEPRASCAELDKILVKHRAPPLRSDREGLSSHERSEKGRELGALGRTVAVPLDQVENGPEILFRGAEETIDVAKPARHRQPRELVEPPQVCGVKEGPRRLTMEVGVADELFVGHRGLWVYAATDALRPRFAGGGEGGGGLTISRWISGYGISGGGPGGNEQVP